MKGLEINDFTGRLELTYITGTCSDDPGILNNIIFLTFPSHQPHIIFIIIAVFH